MKTNPLQSLWIIVMSLVITGNTSLQAIIRRLFGKITRRWCDEEIQRWVKRMVKLLDMRVTIHNPHHVIITPGRPTIIMCNHGSLFDIPLSFLAFPKQSIRMLAKKELANIPLFGSGMRAAEFPTIDRHNRRQAINDLKVLHDLMKSGIVIWIAPEGTRSKTGQLQTLKKGPFITAIQTDALIIPFGIRGATDILPAHSLQFNRHQKADVYIGEPIDARAFTLENKEELVDLVAAQIKTLMGH